MLPKTANEFDRHNAKRPSLTERLKNVRVADISQLPAVTKRAGSAVTAKKTNISINSRRNSWIATQRNKLLRSDTHDSSMSRLKDSDQVVSFNNLFISALPTGEGEYTKSEVDEFKQLFEMFDTDGSGAIGNEELKKAMIKIGLQANDQEIDNLIREIDEDGNGEIDFAEFCTCMKKSQKLVKSTNEEIVRQCFEVFDQDGNGIITGSEFKYIAKEIGGFDEELADLIFNEVDISSNGHLTADQFATIVDDYLFTNNEDASSSKQIQNQQQDADDISTVFSYAGSIADLSS
ncbi:unnamed protein product [Anisakis simplex]|uniref:Uncharacterized calcium-binding protein (inferred by orthology to a C. elegans protein) n=1 Tax=Anisakis simplex TaxID=6269 RepID=A0A0M3K9V8_ANISI|nr:unnamed protein product [Anisakis simplex]